MQYGGVGWSIGVRDHSFGHTQFMLASEARHTTCRSCPSSLDIHSGSNPRIHSIPLSWPTSSLSLAENAAPASHDRPRGPPAPEITRVTTTKTRCPSIRAANHFRIDWRPQQRALMIMQRLEFRQGSQVTHIFRGFHEHQCLFFRVRSRVGSSEAKQQCRASAHRWRHCWLWHG